MRRHWTSEQRRYMSGKPCRIKPCLCLTRETQEEIVWVTHSSIGSLVASHSWLWRKGRNTFSNMDGVLRITAARLSSAYERWWTSDVKALYRSTCNKHRQIFMTIRFMSTNTDSRSTVGARFSGITRQQSKCGLNMIVFLTSKCFGGIWPFINNGH